MTRVPHCNRPDYCHICGFERPMSRSEKCTLASIAALLLAIFALGALFANALEREYLNARQGVGREHVGHGVRGYSDVLGVPARGGDPLFGDEVVW